jgi:hypothetical protein
MRDDMAKVIVERPRRGGGCKFKRPSLCSGRAPGLEELHKREGIRRPWDGDRKSLNENLVPLRRYLRSQVGRPWDKVYGEICQRINRGSAVQLHVWQHLSWEVCTDPHVIRGDVYRSGAFGYPGDLFVDPRTGLLRERRRQARRRRQAAAPRPYVLAGGGRCFRRIDGIWYEVELRPLPEDDRQAEVYDVVLKRHGPLSRRELQELYGGTVYAVKKRQLNKKEIRRLPKAD